MKIKKGDTVKVLVGKDAGRTAKVIKVVTDGSRVVVDGLNLFKKHLKGDKKDKKAAIVDISKPIHVSNVILVCPSCSKPTRVVSKKVGENYVRTCRRCGKSVEISNGDRDEVVHKSKSETKEKVKQASDKKRVTKSSRVTKTKGKSK